MRREPLVLLALLAACSTTPRWEKPGGSPETAAADLELCRRSVPAMSEHEGERFLRDERQVGACMRDMGYLDAAND